MSAHSLLYWEDSWVKRKNLEFWAVNEFDLNMNLNTKEAQKVQEINRYVCDWLHCSMPWKHNSK